MLRFISFLSTPKYRIPVSLSPSHPPFNGSPVQFLSPKNDLTGLSYERCLSSSCVCSFHPLLLKLVQSSHPSNTIINWIVSRTILVRPSGFCPTPGSDSKPTSLSSFLGFTSNQFLSQKQSKIRVVLPYSVNLVKYWDLILWVSLQESSVTIIFSAHHYHPPPLLLVGTSLLPSLSLVLFVTSFS